MTFVAGSAVPTETSVVGQVITWNFGTVAAGATSTSVQLVCNVPNSVLPNTMIQLEGTIDERRNKAHGKQSIGLNGLSSRLPAQ